MGGSLMGGGAIPAVVKWSVGNVITATYCAPATPYPWRKQRKRAFGKI